MTWVRLHLGMAISICKQSSSAFFTPIGEKTSQGVSHLLLKQPTKVGQMNHTLKPSVFTDNTGACFRC